MFNTCYKQTLPQTYKNKQQCNAAASANRTSMDTVMFCECKKICESTTTADTGYNSVCRRRELK